MTTGGVVDVLGKIPVPAGLAGASFLGMDMQHWMYALTITWLTLQVTHFIYIKIIRGYLRVKSKRKRSK